jgi:hypothetical protein
MESNKNKNNNQNQCIKEKNNKNNNNKIIVNEKKLLISISKLPFELFDIVKSYIPLYIWRPLNKTLYFENYNLVYDKIKLGNAENYIRYIVKRDYDYIFKFIVLRNLFRWAQMKDYLNDFLIYPNYIYFIKDFCISNQSNNCLNTLNNILKEIGFEKKLPKKKTIKSILK